jgi:site-specific recombinase XerD
LAIQHQAIATSPTAIDGLGQIGHACCAQLVLENFDHTSYRLLRNLTFPDLIQQLLVGDEMVWTPGKPLEQLERQRVAQITTVAFPEDGEHIAVSNRKPSQVRRLLREIELRQDVRAAAIFSLFLFTGCRVGDAVALELSDLIVGMRCGSVVFRLGKGNKQRTVPLPLPARRAIQTYLECRPPDQSKRLFIGERGALSDRGIRALCDKYSALIGIKIHPHLLRHTMAHRYLADNGNDLVGLAQILGHESLNTTARYSKRTEGQLAEASERLSY